MSTSMSTSFFQMVKLDKGNFLLLEWVDLIN